MPPPPKAKLHKSTGRLKNINSSYANSSSSASSNNRLANASSSTPIALENRNNAVEVPAIEQFELELYWCIQTLENSLSSGKLNPKQGKKKEW